MGNNEEEEQPSEDRSGSKPKTKRQRLTIKRKLLFATLALLLGCAGALVLGEIALRCYVISRGWTTNCYATGLVFFVPHSKAGYSLRPNLRLKSTTYDVSVNARGFRGSEIQAVASENTTRLAVLGGSSVFGYLVGDNLDSCSILEDELNSLESNRDTWFEVINGGIPGFNLTQSRLRFETDVGPLKPDVVLLYLGWNDIPILLSETPEILNRTPPAPPFRERLLGHSTLYGFLRYRLFPPEAPKFTPPSSASTNVSFAGGELFRSELLKMISAIRNSGATPVLSTQVMAATSDATELEPFLGNSKEQIEANKKIGRWLSNCIREVAQEQKVALIDCGATIETSENVLGDAIHLSQQGHRLVAKTWKEGLLPLIETSGDN
ncbi:MAG: SGNH/GDSL hydrolase family protein [Planctomycetota bacterium]